MKTDIEYAAMVIGPSNIAHHAECDEHYAQRDGSDDCDCFQPLHDDGDSRRLENAYERLWASDWNEDLTDDQADRLFALGQKVSCEKQHGTDETVRAAVLALAVAIGKVIDGGGV